MIKVDVDVKDLMTGEIKKIQRQLKNLPKDGHKEFVRLTPIDTGNARRRTNLVGNQIQASYPYAQRLDEGWSKQAPRGIVRPWEVWLRKKIKQILGR